MRARGVTVPLAIVFGVPVLLLGQRATTGGAAAPAAIAASKDDLSPLSPLSIAEKIRFQELSLIKPTGLVSAAFSAGINQWRDVPHAWGQGSEGYAIRFASAEGFAAAHNTVALGFDLALHIDPRYRRRPEASGGARVWNAVRQTLIANTDSGDTMPNVPEFAGSFGAGFISNSWQPAHYNTVEDAVTRGLLALAFHTGKNVAHEFLPDMMKRFRHHGGKTEHGKTDSNSQ